MTIYREEYGNLNVIDEPDLFETVDLIGATGHFYFY